MEAHSGLVLADRYALISVIGRGGMGQVWSARDQVGDSCCALKLLRPDRAEDESMLRRFALEAATLARVGHPGIVKVLDSGVWECFSFIAMELLEGESCAARVSRQGRLSLREAVGIARELLDALAAAHDAGILHRDIKPGNVFLAGATPEAPGRVKLLDFGIAKIFEDAAPTIVTRTGQVLGTPDYLSPEQVRADPVVDARSDLFSVGSLLFEMLTGAPPFRAPTLVATTYHIANSRPPTLRENAGIDAPALQAIIDRALTKQPELRYQSARAFEAALAAIDGGSQPAPDRTPVRSELRPREAPSATASARRGPSTIPHSSGAVPRRGPFAHSGVVRAIDKAIHLRFGRAVRDRVRAQVPAAEPLISGQERGPCPAEVLEAYVAAADRAIVHGRTDLWREVGRAAVELELVSALRPVMTAGGPHLACCVAVDVWSSLFGFGHWRYDGPSATIEVTGFEATSPALRAWLAGLVEQTLHVAGYREFAIEADERGGLLALRLMAPA